MHLKQAGEEDILPAEKLQEKDSQHEDVTASAVKKQHIAEVLSKFFTFLGIILTSGSDLPGQNITLSAVLRPPISPGGTRTAASSRKDAAAISDRGMKTSAISEPAGTPASSFPEDAAAGHPAGGMSLGPDTKTFTEDTPANASVSDVPNDAGTAAAGNCAGGMSLGPDTKILTGHTAANTAAATRKEGGPAAADKDQTAAASPRFDTKTFTEETPANASASDAPNGAGAAAEESAESTSIGTKTYAERPPQLRSCARREGGSAAADEEHAAVSFRPAAKAFAGNASADAAVPNVPSDGRAAGIKDRAMGLSPGLNLKSFTKRFNKIPKKEEEIIRC